MASDAKPLVMQHKIEGGRSAVLERSRRQLQGEVHLLPHHLLFRASDGESFQVISSSITQPKLLYALVYNIDKGKNASIASASTLAVSCRHFVFFRLVLSEPDASNVYDALCQSVYNGKNTQRILVKFNWIVFMHSSISQQTQVNATGSSTIPKKSLNAWAVTLPTSGDCLRQIKNSRSVKHIQGSLVCHLK